MCCYRNPKCPDEMDPSWGKKSRAPENDLARDREGEEPVVMTESTV